MIAVTAADSLYVVAVDSNSRTRLFFAFVNSVRCMSGRTAMFFRSEYTKAEMGIKLSEIDPLIRIKTKKLKFF